MEKLSGENDARVLPDEDRRQNFRRFKGIRERKWGSWVSEIRMPKTRQKIWLGSYKTAEQAARAFDAAVYCLRGPSAKFNFPNSVPAIPSASSLSRQEIQVAAAKYALNEIPSISPALKSNKVAAVKSNKAREEAASPSQLSSVSETDWSCDSKHIPEAVDLGLWDQSPFDGNDCLNLEKIPSIDEALMLEFIPTWKEEQQQGYIFLDPIDLWNFLDICIN